MLGKEDYIFQAMGLKYTFYDQGIYQMKHFQSYE